MSHAEAVIAAQALGRNFHVAGDLTVQHRPNALKRHGFCKSKDAFERHARSIIEALRIVVFLARALQQYASVTLNADNIGVRMHNLDQRALIPGKRFNTEVKFGLALEQGNGADLRVLHHRRAESNLLIGHILKHLHALGGVATDRANEHGGPHAL